ncbi:MAG: hypothetical protein QXE82_04715 [Candidatus Nitrosotenuis sp.]
MRLRTVISTHWIDIHGSQTYTAKVFLTDKDESYMLTVQDGEKRFFKVDAKLLKIGELKFFEKVTKNAIELPIKRTIDMGLIAR